jgi:TusA-related sulfurtransferase
VTESTEPTNSIEQFLDIREDVCPITFVKTRLLIEAMSSGERAEILLRGQEPIENVPSSVRELGHAILEFDRIGEIDDHQSRPHEPGDVRLVIRKA